jgi:hypothetical protein
VKSIAPLSVFDRECKHKMLQLKSNACACVCVHVCDSAWGSVFARQGQITIACVMKAAKKSRVIQSLYRHTHMYMGTCRHTHTHTCTHTHTHKPTKSQMATALQLPGRCPADVCPGNVPGIQKRRRCGAFFGLLRSPLPPCLDVCVCMYVCEYVCVCLRMCV